MKISITAFPIFGIPGNRSIAGGAFIYLSMFLSIPAWAQQRPTLDGHEMAKFGASLEQVRRIYPNLVPSPHNDASFQMFSRPWDQWGRATINYDFTNGRLSSILIRAIHQVPGILACDNFSHSWLSGLAERYSSPSYFYPPEIRGEDNWITRATWVFSDGNRLLFNARSERNKTAQDPSSARDCTISVVFAPRNDIQPRF